MQSSFEIALQNALQHISATLDCPQPKIGIAYSGGLDSTVLLHLCASYAQQHSIQFIAFHVHHGISKNADTWVEHCRRQCANLNLPFEATYVQLENTKEEGVESAARKKRYAALGELCATHQVELLLTAHHQDDQAETMLLQLLRGTGIAGLCGMQPCQRASGLTGNANLWLARPLLESTRSDLENYAKQNKLSYIDDESNADLRYTRNALRHQVMPLLAQFFPGYQSRFFRTAHHMQSALGLLEHLAEQDYQLCRVGSNLDVTLDVLHLRQLPESRIDNVLRYWLAAHHVKMPSTARLVEMRKQLLHARDDAQVRVNHGDIELHRYRQQLSIAPYAQTNLNVQDFIWKGEASIDFPAFSGTLFFDPSPAGQPGIARNWLQAQQLQLRPRQGGERLKLAHNRPTRSMKSHYQTLGIPYWQRDRLPFVFIGDKLLFSAGVGVQSEFLAMAEDGVTLRWLCQQ